jgi:hypothetical protein
MNRSNVLFGLGGAASALLCLALVAASSRPAGAGCGPTQQTCSVPPSAPQVPHSSAPQVAQPDPAPRADTVEALVNKLTMIKAKKAELEQAEKEVAAALKARLKEQRERLRKLGIADEEAAPAVPNALTN